MKVSRLKAFFRPTRTMSTSTQDSSTRKWRNYTYSPSLPVQVMLLSRLKGEHHCYWAVFSSSIITVVGLDITFLIAHLCVARSVWHWEPWACLARSRRADGWAPFVWQARWLPPSGGLWVSGLLPPYSGGPSTRAATRKTTRRGRLGPRAGIPKRMRPNFHQTVYSRVDCIKAKRGEGPKTLERAVNIIVSSLNDDITYATDVLIDGKRVSVSLSVDLGIVCYLPYVDPSAPCRHALDIVMTEMLFSLWTTLGVVMQRQVPSFQTVQKTVEVIQPVPQERIQERITQQVVDVPLPHIME